MSEKSSPLDRFFDLFSIKTSMLCKTLETYGDELDEKQIGKVISELTQLTEMYAHKLLTYGVSQKRTAYIQEEISRVIDETVNTDGVSCQKGCAHCCHWRVEATSEEAFRLVKYAKENRIAIDRDRLEHQAKESAASEFWKTGKRELRRCVFLSDEGGCRVYEARPASCRKCLVYSDPKYCMEPEDSRATPLVVLEAEVLTSLGWSVSSGEVDLLPRVLFSALSDTMP